MKGLLWALLLEFKAVWEDEAQEEGNRGAELS